MCSAVQCAARQQGLGLILSVSPFVLAHASSLEHVPHHWTTCIITGSHASSLDHMHHHWTTCITHASSLDHMHHHWTTCLLQTIRTSLLDLREKAYERSGLGSSYLFRIDESWAVDATRQVNLQRY